MPYDVVVVGNAGIDTQVYLEGEEIDFEHEANFTRNLDCIGQAGGYAARGYASLDLKTAYIGAVGDDINGNWLRQTLFRQGIGTEGIFIDPEGTSRSINLMYQDGRRKNFYDGKGHMKLHPPLAIAGLLFAHAKLIHFNIPNWARELLPLARSSGATIAADIQDVVDPEDPYRRDFILDSNFLFFSAVNHSDPIPLIHHFWQINPNLEMVTGMGAKGCAVATAGDIRFYPPVDLDLPVVDTNGAGDSLAVGYLTARVFMDMTTAEAALRGQIAARHACSLRSDSDHLITQKEFESYLKRR